MPFSPTDTAETLQRNIPRTCVLSDFQPGLGRTGQGQSCVQMGHVSGCVQFKRGGDPLQAVAHGVLRQDPEQHGEPRTSLQWTLPVSIQGNLIISHPVARSEIISSQCTLVLQCCFTCTETVRLIRDWEPSTATSSCHTASELCLKFSSVLLYVHRGNKDY